MNAAPAYSRSSSDASSWWAAIFRALSITLSQAMATATPATGTERDPYVSMPSGAMAVSECSTSTSSGLMPSFSATIIDHAVSCPWPCGAEPVTTCTFEVGRMRTVAASHPPAP